jgi:hypothetical protein
VLRKRFVEISYVGRIPSCAGGISAGRQTEWLLWNADPAGKVGDGENSAGDTYPDDSQDTNYGDIPAVCAGKGKANAGNLAALTGSQERPAGHGLRNMNG